MLWRVGLLASDLTAVLAPASLRKLSPLASLHFVPLGGFVQWVPDYLYGRPLLAVRHATEVPFTSAPLRPTSHSERTYCAARTLSLGSRPGFAPLRSSLGRAHVLCSARTGLVNTLCRQYGGKQRSCACVLLITERMAADRFDGGLLPLGEEDPRQVTVFPDDIVVRRSQPEVLGRVCCVPLSDPGPEGPIGEAHVYWLSPDNSDQMCAKSGLSPTARTTLIKWCGVLSNALGRIVCSTPPPPPPPARRAGLVTASRLELELRLPDARVLDRTDSRDVCHLQPFRSGGGVVGVVVVVWGGGEQHV
ncbi:hypothetical protein T492DRAFT_843791 [Pavlovales sp. CCMP2436]|nr:hypothetical protein T492DRAFT_843791 [Pavlovales sp. CCMP2436]